MNVWVSDHAAVRFRERVRPGLSRHEAGIELARLCREFGSRVDRPAWLPAESMDSGAVDFWLEVAPGVIVACARTARWPVAVTVLCRGGFSSAKRERRNARRRSRPSHRDRTLAGRDAPKKGRVGPDVGEWAA